MNSLSPTVLLLYYYSSILISAEWNDGDRSNRCYGFHMIKLLYLGKNSCCSNCHSSVFPSYSICSCQLIWRKLQSSSTSLEYPKKKMLSPVSCWQQYQVLNRIRKKFIMGAYFFLTSDIFLFHIYHNKWKLLKVKKEKKKTTNQYFSVCFCRTIICWAFEIPTYTVHKNLIGGHVVLWK